tara:strand:- start:33870 stop:34445 length:576 start_codon:yes stop_codon:yes gene_type:complete
MQYNLDSASILRELQNKNHFVFKRLFEDWYADLVNYAIKHLFHQSSSEDVVQDVFIYLWENADKINIQTTLKGYTYAMVRNRCLNILKANKITDTANIMEMQVMLETDYNPDYFHQEEQNLELALMLKVLESLPTKMRTIVKLRFANNYKYSEIAEELGVSVNTIKTQLKRAKAKFGELVISIAIILSVLY